MKLLFTSLFLINIITLTACAKSELPPTDPPPTATVVSLLTQPEQATLEASTLAPTFTLTPTPAPTATNTPFPTATSPLSPTLTLTPTPPLTPTARVSETLTVSVNVRAGPGTNYPVIAQLAPGQETYVTGRNADQSWWQISLPNVATTAGWVYGELVTVTGDPGLIGLVEVAPPPPTATPAPTAVAQADIGGAAQGGNEANPPAPADVADQLRCGKDFCVTYQTMVPIGENGGCIGNHSIYVTVLEGPPPGRPLDGVVIGDTFNNIEVASGDKGPGHAEVTLWMNSMSLKVKRHINGTPFTSEESFSFTSHDELIPAEVLAANGYCDGDVEKCRWAQQNNQVCRGHYSWRVTFHKFD